MSPVNQEASAQENYPARGKETMQLVGFRLAQKEYGIPITRIHLRAPPFLGGGGLCSGTPARGGGADPPGAGAYAGVPPGAWAG